MNRVFIIHSWGSGPNCDWMPWITKELGNMGYEVAAPQMPDTNTPVIDTWVNKLSDLVGDVRESDIFIGHSIGCQTILRFLEKLPSGKKVSQVILVAPWLELSNLENDEMWQIADPWLKSSIDFSKVTDKSNSFVAIFSNNDGWVPMDINIKLFKEKLHPKLVVLPNRGHFSTDEGIQMIPEILDLVD